MAHIKYLGLCHPDLILDEKPKAYIAIDNEEDAAKFLWAVRKVKLSFEVQFHSTTGESDTSTLAGSPDFIVERMTNPEFIASRLTGEDQLPEHHVASFYPDPDYPVLNEEGFRGDAYLSLSPKFFYENGTYYFPFSCLVSEGRSDELGEPLHGFAIRGAGMPYGPGGSEIDEPQWPYNDSHAALSYDENTYEGGGLYMGGKNFPILLHRWMTVRTFDVTIWSFRLDVTEYWPHESVSGLPVYDTSTGAVENDSLS